MDDFSKCQPGDRLWSIQLGECEVISVQSTGVLVKTEKESLSYNINGNYYYNDKYQSLYWSNPNIIPPPKSKKKVKGEVERWTFGYKHTSGEFEIFHILFESEKGVLEFCKHTSFEPSAIPIKVNIPYEIEVDE